MPSKIIIIIVLFALSACGGGGSNEDQIRRAVEGTAQALGVEISTPQYLTACRVDSGVVVREMIYANNPNDTGERYFVHIGQTIFGPMDKAEYDKYTDGEYVEIETCK